MYQEALPTTIGELPFVLLLALQPLLLRLLFLLLLTLAFVFSSTSFVPVFVVVLELSLLSILPRRAVEDLVLLVLIPPGVPDLSRWGGTNRKTSRTPRPTASRVFIRWQARSALRLQSSRPKIGRVKWAVVRHCLAYCAIRGGALDSRAEGCCCCSIPRSRTRTLFVSPPLCGLAGSFANGPGCFLRPGSTTPLLPRPDFRSWNFPRTAWQRVSGPLASSESGVYTPQLDDGGDVDHDPCSFPLELHWHGSVSWTPRLMQPSGAASAHQQPHQPLLSPQEC